MNQYSPSVYVSGDLLAWFKEGSSPHGAFYKITDAEKVIGGVAGMITDEERYKRYTGAEGTPVIENGMYLLCTENLIGDQDALPIWAGRTEYVLMHKVDGSIKMVDNARLRLYQPIEKIGGAERTRVVADHVWQDYRRHPAPGQANVGYGIPTPRA